jgi:hypothetical protein
MIDTITNLLFRCSHSRLTRPITPVSRSGEPQGGTYVLCLDCGKQFPYDLQTMRVGRAMSPRRESGVLHPPVVAPRKSKVRVAVIASAIPAFWLLGKTLLKPKRPGEPPPERKDR